MRTVAICVLALAGVLATQSPPTRAIVTTRRSGTPATQLLAVDLVTGTHTVLPRFPADVLPPLAIVLDPHDGELLLAQDAGSGISRIFRYTMPGGVATNERTLGDVPGHVVELGVVEDDIVAAVDGPQGGLWRLPRSGGTPAMAFALPHLGAVDMQAGAIAWSGSGPPLTLAGMGIVDLRTGVFGWGPDQFFNFPHPAITGLINLGSTPQFMLAHGDGVITTYDMIAAGLPTPVAVQPPVPFGGTVALKPRITGLPTPVVLGGVAFPYLWTFDPAAVNPARSLLSGPLPGDPIDFALGPRPLTQILSFGTACGTPMTVNTLGSPMPGNTVQIGVAAAAPNAGALLVLGFSDQMGGALPLPLPSACLLRVRPDAVLFHVTSASGSAAQAIVIPNQQGLIDQYLFAQWLQAPLLPFDTSAALSVRVGM